MVNGSTSTTELWLHSGELLLKHSRSYRVPISYHFGTDSCISLMCFAGITQKYADHSGFWTHTWSCHHLQLSVFLKLKQHWHSVWQHFTVCNLKIHNIIEVIRSARGGQVHHGHLFFCVILHYFERIFRQNFNSLTPFWNIWICFW